MRGALTTLDRYLVRRNLFLLAVCLGAGLGVYLLVDVFDRMDDFLEAGLPASVIASYFVYKLPLIVTQILPTVFFLAVIVQLGLMARGMELLALRAGGVSWWPVVRLVVAYGFALCLLQFFLSQHLGVVSQQATSRIWKMQVRGYKIKPENIGYNWFSQGPFMVELAEANPAGGEVWDVNVYEYREGTDKVRMIYAAGNATIGDGHWDLHAVRAYDPVAFSTKDEPVVRLPIDNDLSAFKAVEQHVDPVQFSVWYLGGVIDKLEAAGSNVEHLRTILALKWAQSLAMVFLGLAAVALATVSRNVYVNVALGVVVAFGYFVFGMMAEALGGQGIVPPWAAGWMTNVGLGLAAMARILWVSLPNRRVSIRP